MLFWLVLLYATLKFNRKSQQVFVYAILAQENVFLKRMIRKSLMKTLKELRNEELVSTIKTLVVKEREITLSVIEHLQELYDRRIHLSSGYSSIHEYLVKELLYSDGAAHRRISAMRLMQELPEVKQSIADGTLSLTTASTVQNFFRSEKQKHQKAYSKEEKLKVLDQVAGKSKDECLKKLSEVSPTFLAKQKELSIPEDEELLSLMNEFRQLAMIADGTPQTIIKTALRLAIKELKSKTKRHSAIQEKQENSAPLEKLCGEDQDQDQSKNEPHSRYARKAIKQEVWPRDEGRCRFVDPATKRRCTATRHLELDHAKPFALDGETTTENLRLMCRAHNQFLARQTFGPLKPKPDQAHAVPS